MKEIEIIIPSGRLKDVHSVLKHNNLEEQEYPLVDKAYYVDTIDYKVDNSEQWLIDTD
jgi:hypothetical protein